VVTTQTAGLADTIRAWRDRLSPAAAGLPSGHARRAVGLRREELADLAGISVDYVVRLEQGRATAPSVQVVAALARALRLTTAERDHLYRLAGQVPPADGQISEHIPPGVQRVISRQSDAAVAVFAADWQMIWWNPGWAALIGDPSAIAPIMRNFARSTFPTGAHPVSLSRWPVRSVSDEAVQATVVADLRRATGRFPRDARLAALIGDLMVGNERFAELWAGGSVGVHSGDRKVVHHPSVGPITVDCDILTDSDAELKIVIMSAVPDTEDESRLRLALVAGVHTGV
jgi:transcriptional regulator with XRE-family HTH domain